MITDKGGFGIPEWTELEEMGRVTVYAGLGKGKTTAALALGRGVRMIGIESQAKDPRYLADFAEFTGTVKGALTLARKLLPRGECDLLVLDDINSVLHDGSIDTGQVLAPIHERPPNVDVVLTRRFTPQAMIDSADTVTDYAATEQPCQADMGPRKGFDF